MRRMTENGTALKTAGSGVHREAAKRSMARGKRRKRRVSAEQSKEKGTPSKDVPMSEIEQTAVMIDKLMDIVGKMTPAERTRLSVILAHTILEARIST